MANLGTNQTNVQRFFSVNSVKKARRAITIGTLGTAIMTSLAVGCGVVLYGLFHTCDPIKSGCIRIRDELMPYAVMDIFRSFPGMRGLFLAGVFSGSLSTVSSGLNAMVSVIVADFLKPYITWSDSRYERISRILTVILGLTIIGTGFLISLLGDILSIAKSVVGSFGGAYLGIFLMGIWMPFVNSLGAGIGFLCGIVGSFSAFLGSRFFTKPLYLTRKLPVHMSMCPDECGYLDFINATAIHNMTSADFITPLPDETSLTTGETELSGWQNYCSVSYYYVSVLGFSYTVIVGIIVSLLSGGWKQRHSVDKSTIDPLSFSRMGRLLPSKLRDLFGCVDDDRSMELDSDKSHERADENEPLSSEKHL